MPGFLNFGSSNNADQNSNNQNSGNENKQNNNNNDNNSQNNSGNNNQNNNTDNNNNQNNIENNTSIWDNKPNKDDNQQQNQQQQNQNTNEDAASAFAKHISDLNLTNGVDVAKIQQDMSEGSTESLQEAFAKVSANTYQAAMTQMNRLVDNKVNAAVEKSVNESGSMLNENLAIREMNSEMSFTTDKNIAPVANAALKNLMDQGKSASEAIKEVAEFFKNTANMVSGSNGNSDSGAPGRNNFNRNNSVSNNENNNNSNDDDDWLKTLSQL